MTTKMTLEQAKKGISYIFLLFILFCTSCQEESTEIINEEEGVNTIPESTRDLLERISLNDGSEDNIIDRASCIELVLPLTISVNNSPVTIRNIDDYQVVEFLLEENEGDEDTITFNFPIEIILINHTRVTINSLDELQEYIDSCGDENEEDNDIESVDMRYPITFPLFDSLTNDTSTRSVSSDEELFELFSSLTANMVVGVEFPVELQLNDDSIVNITSVDALESTIMVAEASYDEDDDNDFNDDDTVELSEEEFIDVITSCGYLIENLVVDYQNQTQTFANYHFEFYDYNNIVTACIGAILYVGEWEVSTVAENIRLNISFDELDHINQNWIVHGYETGDMVSFDLRLGTDVLNFNMDCFDQTPDIIALLSEGDWDVYYYVNASGQENTQTFSPYQFDFNENGDVDILNTSTQDTSQGTWQVNNFGLELDFYFGAESPLNELNGDNWNIFYFEQDYIELQENSGAILILEKL